MYEEHHRHIARYLKPRCDHFAEVDDVLQETFLVAWRIWANQQVDNVRAWLIGIARRVRLSMRRGAMLGSDGALLIEYEPEADTREAPENQELALYVAQLREKFGCLGPAQAAVMNALADGKTITEVAIERGTTQQAASLAASLARKTLRQMELAA
jgi:DNA-directed RNA polymerase specialized sigma24 family protein